MRVRRAALAALAFLAGAAVRPSPLAAAERAAWFDYAYVEPNSGAASGGHVAVLFDDVAFHFQYLEPGLIQSVKESRSGFAYAYRGLGNRAVHLSRVRIAPETRDLLRDAFERRHVVQEAQLELLDARRRDVGLLEFLRRRDEAATPVPDLPLPAAGYFFCDRETARDGDRVVAALRRRVGEQYGADFLDRRAAVLRREIESLDPAAFDASAPTSLAADIVPAAARPFAGRYGELLQAWLAIDVLRSARGLCPGLLRTSAKPGFALSADEVEALAGRAEHFASRAVALLDSKRPDWGGPFLIAIARQVAIQRSIETRRLHLLDTYADDAESIDVRDLADLGDALRAIRGERRESFESARGKALPAGAGEASWSRLEVTGNLFLEIDRALDEGRPLRGHSKTPLPVRSAPIDGAWPLPRMRRAEIDRAYERAAAREAALAAEIADLYWYDVIRRNCVTEVFEVVDRAFARDDGAPRDASRRRLGGYVGGTDGLNFIPRASLASVDAEYRVEGHVTLPSYRQLRLAELDRSDASPLQRLRESTTLTSTIYTPQLDDGVFLFFTDGAAAARPLLGGINLIAAGGAAVAGIATAPFDRLALFGAAMRGALFSFPELAFVNIRKGSLPVLPRGWVQSEKN